MATIEWISDRTWYSVLPSRDQATGPFPPRARDCFPSGVTSASSPEPSGYAIHSPEGDHSGSMVHQDAPHHLRRHPHELGPIPPVRPVLSDQLEEGFVDQGCGLKCVAGALIFNVVAGQPPQLLVDQRKQTGEGILAAEFPLGQQTGDLPGRVCHCSTVGTNRSVVFYTNL